MKSCRVLAAMTLATLLVLSATVVYASPARVRVLVGVSRFHGWDSARAALGLLGRVEGEIPEIRVAILSLPRSAVERVKALSFVEYVEEDMVIELATRQSSSNARVRLAEYTGSVTVVAGGSGEVSFTVKNVGRVDIAVVVELRDEKDVAQASTGALALPAGSSYSGNLAFAVPGSPGSYSWTIAVVDAKSGVLHDYGAFTVHVTSSPSGSLSSSQSGSSSSSYTDIVYWNVRMINATKVWSEFSSYGDSAYGYHAVVQVAVLDTGVDYTHGDLSGAVVWCVVSLGAGSTFYRGRDLSRCADPHGHGTLVAGIIAARLNSWGMAGAAPKVVLYAVRVIDPSGTIYVSDVARGIVEAVKGPDGLPGTDDDADVISTSFGGGSSTTLYNAIKYAYSYGAVLVAAAGNSGGSTPVYPAAYPEVIAVGAVDRHYAVPGWSNRNPDVVAPGSTVVSTYPGNRHVAASGTSIACPHVSAAVALVQALRLAAGKQKLAPAQVIQLIRETALDLGTAGYDSLYGYGLLNAYAAVAGGLSIG